MINALPQPVTTWMEVVDGAQRPGTDGLISVAYSPAQVVLSHYYWLHPIIRFLITVIYWGLDGWFTALWFPLVCSSKEPSSFRVILPQQSHCCPAQREQDAWMNAYSCIKWRHTRYELPESIYSRTTVWWRQPEPHGAASKEEEETIWSGLMCPRTTTMSSSPYRGSSSSGILRLLDDDDGDGCGGDLHRKWKELATHHESTKGETSSKQDGLSVRETEEEDI